MMGILIIKYNTTVQKTNVQNAYFKNTAGLKQKTSFQKICKV